MNSTPRILASITALILASCASDTAEPSTTAYEGYAYLSNYVEVDSGLRMHYLDEGSGAPILLIHGVPTQAYLWRNVVPPLAERGRVIVPDMINFGLSDKTDPLTPAEHVAHLTRLIETLELENVTLVLHDWGVPWGLSYAEANPANVRAIVFFEGPALPIPDMSGVPPFLVQNLLDPATARPSIVDNNWFIECFVLDPMCGGSRREWTDTEREVYRAPFLTDGDREQLMVLPQHLPFVDTTGHPVLDPDGPGGEPAQPSPSIAIFQANAAYLMSSEVPKLFIYSEPGALPMGAMVGARYQTLMPNLDIAQVGSPMNPAFHFVQEDVPDELAQAIGTFIDNL